MTAQFIIVIMAIAMMVAYGLAFPASRTVHVLEGDYPHGELKVIKHVFHTQWAVTGPIGMAALVALLGLAQYPKMDLAGHAGGLLAAWVIGGAWLAFAAARAVTSNMAHYRALRATVPQYITLVSYLRGTMVARELFWVAAYAAILVELIHLAA